MKTLFLTLMTALWLTSCSSMAKKEMACTCDHKCTEVCQSGKENKDCDCKACDCAKTGSCSHGKCGDHGEHDGHKH